MTTPFLDATQYLDRQLTNAKVTIASFFNPTTSLWTTTWTLPYSVATDGSQGTLVVVRTDTGTVVPTTRFNAGSISALNVADLSAIPVLIGVSYTFRYRFSTFFQRSQDGSAFRGNTKLILRRLLAYFDELCDATLRVAHATGRHYAYTKSHPTAIRSQMSVPVHGDHERVTVELVADGVGACALTEVTWEAEMAARGRRV